MIDFSALQDQECSEGPATVIAEGFPRACYITDDNVQWLSKQKGKWDDLPVSSYYACHAMQHILKLHFLPSYVHMSKM